MTGGNGDVLFAREGRVGRITLNRPQALNALTLEMLAAIEDRLVAWADDPAVELVVAEGAGGRAFAAGGDIQRLWEAGRAGDRYTSVFFWNEYLVDWRVHRYPKPYVAIVDGIVMGGGVGVSILGSHRVATERTQFAMPETGIGFFPDVGGTWFLPRLPGRLGRWLALTGGRLGGADCRAVGLATHFVPSDGVAALKAALAEEGIAALDRHAADPGPAPIAGRLAEIDRLFAGGSVEAIVAALEADGGELAAEALRQIAGKSPTSLKVAFEQVRRGAALDLEGALSLEYRMSQRFMAGHDFFEGVRALIVDKDRKPQWRPARLADVDPAAVAAYFAPLADRELGFDPPRRLD